MKQFASPETLQFISLSHFYSTEANLIDFCRSLAGIRSGLRPASTSVLLTSSAVYTIQPYFFAGEDARTPSEESDRNRLKERQREKERSPCHYWSVFALTEFTSVEVF